MNGFTMILCECDILYVSKLLVALVSEKIRHLGWIKNSNDTEETKFIEGFVIINKKSKCA